MSSKNSTVRNVESKKFVQENNIICGDSRNILTDVEDESIQLTVTSPPYNIGKDYTAGYNDSGPIEEWKLMMEDVFKHLFRVTKPDGKVVINIGKSFSDSDIDGRFKFYPLPAFVKQIALNSGFDMWDEIIWNKQGFASRGGGALMGSYPYPTNLMVTQTHEHILVFRKWVNNDYHKSRDMPELGTKKRENSALTKERWRKLTQSIWEFNGVRQSDYPLDHGAIFPEELPKRAIQLYSFCGDTVLDPFLGSGTTAVSAKKAGRNYIGIEKGEKFVEHAKERVSDCKFEKEDYVAERE